MPLKAAKLIIFKDFESTAVGGIPKGFTKKGSCAVVGDVALYNVQPRKGRKEFGANSRAAQKFTDQWTLAEWYVDHVTQSYRFFLNGQELTDLNFHKGEGKYEGAEIPAAFESLSFGWCNYQPVQDPSFVVWIDDLAVGKDRIGDQTMESTAKASKKK